MVDDLADYYPMPRHIRVGEATHRLEWLLLTRAGQAELDQARRDGAIPQCSCLNKPLPLVIAERDDQLVLRRYPLTGRDHRAECRYHGGISPEQTRLYASTALASHDDVVRIHLGHSTQREGDAGLRTRMSLAGLLHLLWENAGLNRWYPRMEHARRATSVQRALCEAAGELVVDDSPLRSWLYLVEPLTTRPEATGGGRLAELLLHRPKALEDRLLVLGWLRHVRENHIAVSGQFPLLLDRGLRVTLSSPTAATAGRSLLHHLARGAALENDCLRVVVLADVRLQIGRKDGDCAVLRDLAMMPVTSRWIPVADEAEAAMADHLAVQSRAFTKPLWYDGPRALHPAFQLIDTPHPVDVEVMASDRAYNEQRRQNLTARTPTALLWDTSRPWTPLPPPQRPIPTTSAVTA
jgi:hypothetical protein